LKDVSTKVLEQLDMNISWWLDRLFETQFLPGILLKSHVTFFNLISHFPLELFQNKFKVKPVVLTTAEHLRTGKEYDAALIWTEDVTKDSFKVCLRELQNFDGKHEDIRVVRTS